MGNHCVICPSEPASFSGAIVFIKHQDLGQRFARSGAEAIAVMHIELTSSTWMVYIYSEGKVSRVYARLEKGVV